MALPRGGSMEGTMQSETNAQVVEFRHRWKITNFAWLDSEPSTATRSPPFRSAGHEWQLHVYPNGMRAEDKGFVGIFLASVSCHEHDGLRARFKSTILNKCPELNFEREDKLIKCYGTWGWNRFVDRERLLKTENGYVTNDTVTIEVVVWVRSGIVSTTHPIETPLLVISPPTIAAEMGELLRSADHSDMTISCAGEEIPVHKCILALRSKVFRAMLTHNMQENRDNTLIISDTDPEVLKELVSFIYTDECSPEVVEKCGVELMKMADKYELARLRTICEHHLSKSLTVENVVDRLTQADMCQAAGLKAKCVAFLCSNLAEVSDTEQYKNLCQMRPDLLVDVVDYQAQRAIQTSTVAPNQTTQRKRRRAESGQPSS